MDTLVLDLALLTGDWIAHFRIIAGIDDCLAESSKFGLSTHDEQWRVEKRMVLAQVFFSLVTLHLSLLSLSSQYLNVELLRIARSFGILRTEHLVLFQMLVGVLHLHRTAHRSSHTASVEMRLCVSFAFGGQEQLTGIADQQALIVAVVHDRSDAGSL